MRVSTQEQAAEGKAGLQSQYDVTDRIIQANGYELIVSVELIDISGTATLYSEEFQKLMGMVERRELDVVVAREISRIARPDSMEAMQVFDVFKRSGCLIAAGDLSIDFSSPDGWLSGGLHALIAGHERMMLLRKMMAAKEAKRRKGQLAGADFTLPTGVSYDWDKNRFYYNEKVHKVIEAFRLIDEEGIRNLSEVSRRVGLLPWTLKRLLRNELFIGFRTYTEKVNPTVKRLRPGGRQGYRPMMKRAPEEVIRVRVIDEPAVSTERFERVQKVLQEIHFNYTTQNKQIRYVNLTTVVGRCGICGQPIYSTANGRRYENGTKGAGFFACKSHHPRSRGKLPKCGSGWGRREAIDELVATFCQQKLTDPEFLTTLISGSLARSSEVIVQFPEHGRQEAIDALRRREKKVLEIAEADLITVAQARERQAAIRLDIAQLEEAARRERGTRPGIGIEDLVQQVVRGALAFSRIHDKVQKKQIVESLFSEIFIRLREQSIVAFKFSAELLARLGPSLPNDIINLEVPFSIKPRLPEGHKQCTACKKVLLLKDFNKGQSWCRECQKTYHAERKRAGTDRLRKQEAALRE